MYKYIKQPLSCKLQKLKTKHNWNKNPETPPKAVKPEMERSDSKKKSNTFDGSQRGRCCPRSLNCEMRSVYFFRRKSAMILPTDSIVGSSS